MIALILSAGGCAGIPPPSLSPEAKATMLSIESMTLLPIISDTPLPPETRQKVLATVHERVGLDLALKGYVFEKADHFSPHNTYTPEDVARMSVKDLALLGPEDSRYLVLCILQEFDSANFIFWQSSKAGIMAMIIDKRHKAAIWKNEDSSRSTTGIFLRFGGLIEMLVADEESEALFASVRQLFSTIPEKP